MPWKWVSPIRAATVVPLVANERLAGNPVAATASAAGRRWRRVRLAVMVDASLGWRIGEQAGDRQNQFLTFSQSVGSAGFCGLLVSPLRSEEPTSELQSLMRISYA